GAVVGSMELDRLLFGRQRGGVLDRRHGDGSNSGQGASLAGGFRRRIRFGRRSADLRRDGVLLRSYSTFQPPGAGVVVFARGAADLRLVHTHCQLIVALRRGRLRGTGSASAGLVALGAPSSARAPFRRLRKSYSVAARTTLGWHGRALEG